jgi:hypothetical protein
MKGDSSNQHRGKTNRVTGNSSKNVTNREGEAMMGGEIRKTDWRKRKIKEIIRTTCLKMEVAS